MIANQSKNRSFRSTLEYALEKEEAFIIDSNMGGYTPRQLAKEFAAARRMRPLFQRACGHIVLSLPHREASHPQGQYHEHLDDEKYALLARRWLKEMQFLGDGLHKSQYVIARHQDTNHEHIHIIASRIRMDGSVVPDSWDYRRSEVIVRKLEKEFGLEPTPCSNERVALLVKQEHDIETEVSERRAQTKKQKHHKSGKPPVKQLLADAIDEATADHPTVTELIARLQQQGINVHPSFSTRGKFKEAVAFSMDGVKMAGWKLGKAYSFPGLQKKRGVDYNLERDMPALRAAQDGELVRLPVRTRKHKDDEIDDLEQSSQKRHNANQEINLIQKEYIARIAHTIRQFWEIKNTTKPIEGNYYNIKLEEGILMLTRKSGEKLAAIPLDRTLGVLSFNLNQSDVERFLELQRILERHKSQTKPTLSQELER